MLKHMLSVLAFIIVSFSVQGLNHFLINKAHYGEIEFARAEPILSLGFLTMIIQGLILSLALAKIAPTGTTFRDGLSVSLAFGLFLASYIALAEPAKYAAPSVSSWMITEGIASTIQFVIVGLCITFIHQRFQSDFSKSDSEH